MRGHIAIDAELLKSTRVMRKGLGSQVLVGSDEAARFNGCYIDPGRRA